VERTRKQRERIVVQDFWTTALTTDVKTDKKTGAKYYGTTIPDIRIFSLLFADGTAHAGEQSFLIRTDVQDIGKTNTGSGGGYGILAILGEPGRRKDLNTPLVPPRPEVAYVSKRHMEELLAFVVELDAVTTAAERGTLEKNGRASALGEKLLRPVMDLLGDEITPLLRLTRRFDAGEISAAQLHDALLELRFALQSQAFPNAEVTRQVRQNLATRPTHEPTPIRLLKHQVETHGAPVPLPQRHQLGDDVVLFATGRVLDQHSAFERVRSEGGQIEVMRAQQRSSGAWTGTGLPPCFYIDDRGRPHLAASADSPHLTADILSLMPAFERWLETRNELIDDGNLPAKAAQLAFDFHKEGMRDFSIEEAKKERTKERTYLTKLERILTTKPKRKSELLRVRIDLASNRDRLLFDDVFSPLEQRMMERDGTYDRAVEQFKALGEEVPRFKPSSRWSDTFALVCQKTA
jgi:hypothetical protein